MAKGQSQILMVDDAEDIRGLLKATLEGRGYVCHAPSSEQAPTTEATTGYQAPAKLHSAGKRGEPHDVLILDQRMLGMDLLEVATHIQTDQRIARTIVMILAPDAGTDEISRLQELGVEFYLKQPVQQSELSEDIRPASNTVNGSAAETVPASLSTADGRSLNILVVDDVLANRKLVHAYLKTTPHQIDIAENGEMAVRKFVSGNYDLVFMDIQMPVMDGYAATKAMRKW